MRHTFGSELRTETRSGHALTLLLAESFVVMWNEMRGNIPPQKLFDSISVVLLID